MQETRYDGDVVLTDRATQEQVERAMSDPSNKVVALHKPGSEVTLRDGSKYVCQADGSWKRVKSAIELHAEMLQRRIEELERGAPPSGRTDNV